MPVLKADVLVHHDSWQAWPHHGAAESAKLDDLADILTGKTAHFIVFYSMLYHFITFLYNVISSVLDFT